MTARYKHDDNHVKCDGQCHELGLKIKVTGEDFSLNSHFDMTPGSLKHPEGVFILLN